MKALSLVLGTAFGLCAWVILRLYWPAEAWIAVPTGIGFTVLLYAALQMAELWESRRYERMEARFSEPARFACKAVCGGKACRLYLFSDTIELLFMDEKPYFSIAEPISSLRDVQKDFHGNTLTLFFEGKGQPLVLITDAEKAYTALWNRLNG